MKKWMRKTLAFMIAVCIAAAGLGGIVPAKAAETGFTAQTLADAMVGNEEDRIDEVTVGGRTCYMFVPESTRVGNFLALTPIVVVFGDEPYTAETVQKSVDNDGYGEIARRDGLCILFANPIEAWDSEADKEAAAQLFAGIYEAYSSRPDLVFENGKAIYTDEDGGEHTVYPGSLHGLQMYGVGSGADYIAANYLTPQKYSANYALQYFPELMGTPSGVGLFQPTSITEGDGTLVIPMAIVNGPENSEAVAVSYNENAGVYKIVADEGIVGFNRELVVSLYDEVISKYYYSQGQLRDSAKYNINGIVELNYSKELSTGKTVEYYCYIPDDLDLSIEQSVPLMLWFHGMGGEAEAMMSWTEWPLIGKEDGFMVLSVDQHPSITADETMELLDLVLEESPYIDTRRIYASGFSMGSAKTWSIGLEHSERFAGIIPAALGVFAFGDNSAMVEAVNNNEGNILPVFYLAGGESAMELGSSPYTQEAMKFVCQLNGIGEYAYDENVGRWGIEPDSTRVLEYMDNADHVLNEEARHQVLTIDSFKSEDGNVYTWFALNEYKPHTITNNDAHVVWEYMKHFSRNPDGTISIDGEHEHIWDDGVVTKEPSYSEEGTKTYTCNLCGEKNEESIPKLERPYVPDDPTPSKPKEEPVTFKDVEPGSYYEEAVKWSVKEKLITGTSAETFSPEETITRAQLIELLWKAAGSPKTKAKDNPFTDVKSDDAFYNAVMWAMENKITTGTSANTFSPNEAVTRGQTVTLLWRMKNSPQASAEAKFADVRSDDFFAASVAWAGENGITLGTSETAFSPNVACTRGQVVTFVFRTLGK